MSAQITGLPVLANPLIEADWEPERRSRGGPPPTAGLPPPTLQVTLVPASSLGLLSYFCSLMVLLSKLLTPCEAGENRRELEEPE